MDWIFMERQWIYLRPKYSTKNIPKLGLGGSDKGDLRGLGPPLSLLIPLNTHTIHVKATCMSHKDGF